MNRQQVHSQATVLAKKENLGLVACCPAGCFHLTIQNVSIRLSRNQYLALVGMLNESTGQIQEELSREVLH